jgi:hypothetical protein
MAASLPLAIGCPKHEEFPAALELVTAPAPSNFVVNALGEDVDGNFEYDLTWGISDPTNVDRYRLYLVGAGLTPELVQETTATFLPIELPFDAAGLQFGLSTVSTGLVESSMQVATVPAVP